MRRVHPLSPAPAPGYHAVLSLLSVRHPWDQQDYPTRASQAGAGYQSPATDHHSHHVPPLLQESRPRATATAAACLVLRGEDRWRRVHLYARTVNANPILRFITEFFVIF